MVDDYAGFIHAPSGELLATTMQNGDADIGSRFIDVDVDVDGEVVGLEAQLILEGAASRYVAPYGRTEASPRVGDP